MLGQTIRHAGHRRHHDKRDPGPGTDDDFGNQAHRHLIGEQGVSEFLRDHERRDVGMEPASKH